MLIAEDQGRLQEMVSHPDQQCKKIWYDNLESQDGINDGRKEGGREEGVYCYHMIQLYE